jgi:hypothetical protein
LAETPRRISDGGGWNIALYTLIAYILSVSQVSITVVETPLFIKKASSIFDDDERAALIVFVAANPEAGRLIPETDGVRKLRWAAKGKGKSGGARIIYYFHNETIPIFMLSAYAKGQKADISKAERNALKKLIPQLLNEYAKRRMQ